MADIATRMASWYGHVLDLLRQPVTAMPVSEILTLLRLHFEVTGSSWHWFEPDGSFGTVLNPPGLLDAEEETQQAWLSGELLDCNPLIVWFGRTGDPRPQSAGRVPRRLVPRARWRILERPLLSLALDQQLSIPYRMNGNAHRAFVLARGRSDFDDDDLLLAGWVQSAVRCLDEQVSVLRRLQNGHGSPTIAVDVGLTGRELAVLQLIADGLTTRSTARRLRCSPRTVEKHLERCYRKLGVKDRLNAVRLVRELGLVATALGPEHVLAPGTVIHRSAMPAYVDLRMADPGSTRFDFLHAGRSAGEADDAAGGSGAARPDGPGRAARGERAAGLVR